MYSAWAAVHLLMCLATHIWVGACAHAHNTKWSPMCECDTHLCLQGGILASTGCEAANAHTQMSELCSHSWLTPRRSFDAFVGRSSNLVNACTCVCQTFDRRPTSWVPLHTCLTCACTEFYASAFMNACSQKRQLPPLERHALRATGSAMSCKLASARQT